jgi:DNA-directed RNA polymerase specialized sigma24 family protein
MGRITNPGPDDLLREWQRETNAERKDLLLEQLLWTHARPVTARVVGARWLTLQRVAGGEGDADDLVQRVQLQVLRVMRRAGDRIESFVPYVATAARNAVNQVIRRNNSHWYSMSNTVRYVLTHHPELALWRLDDQREVAGLARDRGQSPFPDARDLSEAEALFRRENHHEPNRARRKVNMVRAIVLAAGGPVWFDTLVNTAVVWADLQNRRPRSLDEQVAEDRSLADAIASGRPSAEQQIVSHEAVRQLWEEIRGLAELVHRRVLLLNVSEGLGASIETFEEANIATIAEIADALEYDREWFAALCNSLPLPDGQIAGMLGLTPEQVTDRRKSARRTLARRMKARLSTLAEPRRQDGPV